MKRKAVLIGINSYRSVSGLRGCVNDVTNLRLALKDLAGFENADIRVVADERATKSAIEDRLAWLVRDAVEGDLLVLHFSGHGSQVRDRGEQDELVDHLDEILCPWDMDWDGTFITDDYLRDHLNVPPGVVLEVILDACHSGDASVEVGLPAHAPEPPRADRAPRFLNPPVDIVSRHEGEQLPTQRLLRENAPGRLALWSACADFQTAADANFGGVFNGAFSFHLCQHLRESQGQISREELLRRVRSSLRQAGYAQVPELAAPADLKGVTVFRT